METSFNHKQIAGGVAWVEDKVAAEAANNKVNSNNKANNKAAEAVVAVAVVNYLTN